MNRAEGCDMASPASLTLPGSLPIPRSRLIGREKERAWACAYLLDETAPLLTLTGSGGVGKTRLALAVARDVEAQFADGVHWVDLAPVTDPLVVLAAVASGIGLSSVDDTSLLDAMVRILRPRQTLLLVDNCEHLLDETAALIAGLLDRCPALQVLATSRAPLRLRGEQALPLAPLPLPAGDRVNLDQVAGNAAVTLFVERARAAQPAFALTEANAPDVARLCRQLDGLPLAIELAAARIPILSPAALAASLSERLHMPGGGPRDLPARQQTIETTIAWSYALLDEKAQVLFRRLSAFLGGFTLEAARAARPAGQTAEDAITGLTALIEQSLVHPTEAGNEPRFTMLETVRAFALERLDEAGERDAANDAHAAYYIAWARGPASRHSLSSGVFGTLYPHGASERANIRAAMGHLIARGNAEGALQLAGVFSPSVHVNPREGRSWIEWALAHAAATPSVPRGFALAELALFLWCRTEYEQALPFAEASFAVAEHLDDVEVRAVAVDALGTIALSQHHYARARSLFVDATALWRRVREPTREATALQQLAGAEHGLGDDESAMRHVLHALAIHRGMGSDVGVANTLARLGRQRRDLGNDRDAALAFHEALERCADGTDRFVLTQAYAGLAELASRRGQPEIAASLIGAIDVIARDVGATRLPWAGMNYDRATAAASAALGGERFESLRAAGGKLRLDEAVALARLVEIPPAAPGEPDPAWSRLRLVRSGAGDEAASGHARSGDIFRVEPRQQTGTPAVSLTYREQDVLALLAQRFTDSEIAERLFISRKTVSNHVSNILGKLGAANRREATAMALRQGLL